MAIHKRARIFVYARNVTDHKTEQDHNNNENRENYTTYSTNHEYEYTQTARVMERYKRKKKPEYTHNNVDRSHGAFISVSKRRNP